MFSIRGGVVAELPWLYEAVGVWLGGWGIALMKNKFQKASITSAQAQAPAFAFQCEVQPPLFMMLYTSKPQPTSLSPTLSFSPYPHSNHYPWVSRNTVRVCSGNQTAACGMVWYHEAFDRRQLAGSSKLTWYDCETSHFNISGDWQ